MYTNANGSVVNGKDLEFKDHVRKNTPNIVGFMGIKLTKEMRSRGVRVSKE